MRWIFVTSLWALTALAFAQPNQAREEAVETIRFIRLAETKKNLDLSDDLLLKVNEIFDDYEHKRFTLIRQEQMFKRRGSSRSISVEEAETTFADFLKVRQQLHDLEMQLWNDMSKVLNGQQVIDVFVFYDQFQKEVFRRIRNLQEKRMNNRPRQRRMDKNQ